MKEKKVKNLKFNSKIMKIFTILMIGLILIFMFFWIIRINLNDKTTEFFALQTFSGFNDALGNSKYKITNQQELDLFSELYEGFRFSNKYDLSNNTIFIQTQQLGSSSYSIKFRRVKIDDNVEFMFSFKSPIGGLVTDDSTYWYLVAVIPNVHLEGVNTDEWKSPVDAKNNLIEIDEVEI